MPLTFWVSALTTRPTRPLLSHPSAKGLYDQLALTTTVAIFFIFLYFLKKVKPFSQIEMFKRINLFIINKYLEKL